MVCHQPEQCLCLPDPDQQGAQPQVLCWIEGALAKGCKAPQSLCLDLTSSLSVDRAEPAQVDLFQQRPEGSAGLEPAQRNAVRGEDHGTQYSMACHDGLEGCRQRGRIERERMGLLVGDHLQPVLDHAQPVVTRAEKLRVGLRDPDSNKYTGDPANWDKAEQACRDAAHRQFPTRHRAPRAARPRAAQ